MSNPRNSSPSAEIESITAPSHPDILYGTAQTELIRHEVLADLLEATAAQFPEQAALIVGERVVTYAQLNSMADLAASHLISAGVRPGQLIGLWLARGVDLLVMQAAIAKPVRLGCRLMPIRLWNASQFVWTMRTPLASLLAPI